jgi:hypothetical protein
VNLEHLNNLSRTQLRTLCGRLVALRLADLDAVGGGTIRSQSAASGVPTASLYRWRVRWNKCVEADNIQALLPEGGGR